MNRTDQDIEFWELSKLARLHRPIVAAPTRRRAKAGRKVSKAIVRDLRGEKSMIHAGQPKGHKPVAGVLDTRTAVLFAKWHGRVERRLQERNNQ